MPVGYFTDVTEANDYFDLERLETECWDGLGSGSGIPYKDKLLLNAFNRLYYDPRWSLPDPAGPPSAADLVVLKKAQAEEAYYLCVHLEDEDRRKGIEAQGVIEAGIVKEKYDQGSRDDLPVPAVVQALLYPWLVDYAEFGIVDIGRDEEVSAKTKVTGFWGK
jgi:hypothetical protein